jgi:hypothetical protein
MASIPYHVRVQGHPGSTADEIANEPDWEVLSGEHRVGYRNRQDRWPGLTNAGGMAQHKHTLVQELMLSQMRRKKNLRRRLNKRRRSSDEKSRKESL